MRPEGRRLHGAPSVFSQQPPDTSRAHVWAPTRGGGFLKKSSSRVTRCCLCGPSSLAPSCVPGISSIRGPLTNPVHSRAPHAPPPLHNPRPPVQRAVCWCIAASGAASRGPLAAGRSRSAFTFFQSVWPCRCVLLNPCRLRDDHGDCRSRLALCRPGGATSAAAFVADRSLPFRAPYISLEVRRWRPILFDRLSPHAATGWQAPVSLPPACLGDNNNRTRIKNLTTDATGGLATRMVLP